MITILWSGLGLGAIYGIVGITYAITLAATGTFNFAQAQFVTVGVFTAYVLSSQHNAPLVATVLGSGLVTGLVAFAEERFVLRFVRKTDHHVVLIVTLGFAVVIDGIAFATWGSDPRRVTLPGDHTVGLLGGRVSISTLILVAALIVLTAGLKAIDRWTRWGLAMRATAADPAGASLRGVNTRLVGTVSFVAAAVVVGLLSLPIGTRTFAVFNLGDVLLTFSFVSLAVGGFRSYPAIAGGGLLTGVVISTSTRYFDGSVAHLIVFALVVVVLLVRPYGIGSAQQTRAV